jgi:hypothetical protein
MLMDDNAFHDKNLYKTFIIFQYYINHLNSFNDSQEYIFKEDELKKTRFFSKSHLKKYKLLEDELKLKYGDYKAFDGCEDDEDEDEEESKENEDV